MKYEKRKKCLSEGIPQLLSELSPERMQETYQALRAQLLLSPLLHQRTVLTLTGMKETEIAGVCANLSIAFAHVGDKVLLVDADLRQMPLSRLFYVQSAGLAAVLLEEKAFSETVCREVYPDLDVLPAGRVLPDPCRCLGSEPLCRLLKEQRQEYDWIILNCPSVDCSLDALLAARDCGCILLCVTKNRTKHAALSKAITKIQAAQIPVAGFILLSR